MNTIQSLHALDKVKLLADPRRRAILQELMLAPASLTMLGKAIGEHPAWIRHHLKQLESAGLVELVETRVQAGVVEKFYRAAASGYMVQELIVPQKAGRPVVVFSGSHDLAVELLAQRLVGRVELFSLTVGSLDGLLALRQNICSIAGAHLLDPGGEYNLPYIRHIFPDRAMQVVTLAHRQQGLMIAPGNPKAIHSIEDLARPGVRFINRNRGSGTRLSLDRQLSAMGIPPEQVRGYGTSCSTHTACAELVQGGEADVALGVEAAAHQFGLDFVPLYQERYDFVFSQEQCTSLLPLLDTIQSKDFRRRVDALTGYDTSHTGDQVAI